MFQNQLRKVCAPKSGKQDSLQPTGRLVRASNPCFAYFSRQAFGTLAALTLCGILVAGLWPFHSPKNQVYWLEKENGLRFGHHATILSTSPFEVASSDGPSCSLEIWLEPARTWATGTILAFYRPLNSRQLSLQQRYTDLALQLHIGGVRHREPFSEMVVDQVFRKRQLFVTVTSNGRDTAVYIDGRFVTRVLGFELSADDLAGKLIVATSALQGDSWTGQLRGLAIYRSELNSAQVAQHHEGWTQNGKPAVAENERPLALYLFDEREGKIIHNQMRRGIDLYIPERYLVVDQTLLESPWKEFRTQRNYLKNVFINIAGFVPLGFFFYGYFSSARRVMGASVATVIVGLTVSFTIEILQAYLPTRDSGMTDIITNTLGTCIGVLFYRAAAPLLGSL